MVDSIQSDSCGSPGFLLEASEEEWIKKAGELIAPLLTQAECVQAFRGRWIMIRMRLQGLSEALDSVCESLSLQQSFLHHKSTLPQIVASLVEGTELVQKSINLSYGGKLLMQSNLDALITKLDHHLRDINEVKNSIKQYERALAITRAMTHNRDSEETPSQSHRKEQVWDIFAKLRAGNVDTKRLALEILIEYMHEDDKAALLVATEGDVCHLIHLLDSSSLVIREMAADAVCIMAMVDKCKKDLIAQGALQPLLRVLESGSMHAKEKAALALLELTCIAENAHSVASQAGAIPLLVKLCKQGIHPGMTGAAGTLCNLARNEHIRRALAENGAIDALISLLSCSSSHAKQYAAKALQNLASGKDDKIRTSIAMNGGIHSLLTFLKQATSADSQETAIQALGKLVTSATSAKTLVSAGYVIQLTELLNTGSARVQHLATLAICNLSSHMDLKRHGFATPLVKMFEAKDISQQKVAAQALSHALLVKSIRHKEEVRTLGFLSLLNACKHSLTKKFSRSALLTLPGASTNKNRIMSAEAQPYIDERVDMNATGPSKALQRLGGRRLLAIFSRSKPTSSSSCSSSLP